MPWKSKLHRCMFYWGEVPGPQGFHWKILQQILFDHLHCSRYMVFKRHGCCQNRQNSLASWILHPAGMKCKCIYLWRSDFYCDIWSLQGFPGGSDMFKRHGWLSKQTKLTGFMDLTSCWDKMQMYIFMKIRLLLWYLVITGLPWWLRQ